MKTNEMVIRATQGNKEALESIIILIQDNVYYLALRMLANKEDAKDATQEILIKVVTNLSSFRLESQFNTWVYRIAVNHLLSEKKSHSKHHELTFDLYKKDLESDLQEPSNLSNDPSYQILINELRISCTMAMLLCLNPAHRMAYILGDIFEMEHAEASEVLSISKSNFRKQLSRARTKVIEFTSKSCGFVNPCAKCSCEKKVTGAVARKRVSYDDIYFADDDQYSYEEIRESLAKTKHDLKTLALQTSINHYKCPIKLSTVIESLVNEAVLKQRRHSANNYMPPRH